MLILVADDEPGIRTTLSEVLGERHETVVCDNGKDALALLEKRVFDVVITDHQMPGLTGLELIRKGRELSPDTSFLLMTAFGTVEQAVDAIRLGAEDYFLKPFDLDEIDHRIGRIEKLRAYQAERELISERATGAARLLGDSASMRSAREFVAKVTGVPSPVLILGPSGTGKEVLARAIHESGPRRDRPFVAVNCASLTEQLMDSELFGHEKGAFTGAIASRAGKFELAQGGTLFLDEIGELTQGIQAKLLRVLQEKEFFRVGGVRQIKSDARVVTATHRPIRERVSSGEFREDLYFRLNVLSFELAPLADRPEDIPLLLEHFWARATRELGRKVELSPDARETLCRHSYPGNVRELQNLVERIIVLGPERGAVTRAHLPAELRLAPAAPATGPAMPADYAKGLDHVLEELEGRIVRDAYEQCEGNQVRTAALLKITRGALQYKLKKYGIGPSAVQAA